MTPSEEANVVLISRIHGLGEGLSAASLIHCWRSSHGITPGRARPDLNAARSVTTRGTMSGEGSHDHKWQVNPHELEGETIDDLYI